MKNLSTEELEAIVGRLPTTRDEDWKYTDLAAARALSTRWLAADRQAQGLSLDDEIERIQSTIDADWVVIANGELRDRVDVEGLTMRQLDQPPAADSALAELNAALLKDGLSVRIERPLSRPLGILVIDGAREDSVSQAYISIEFAAGASGDVVEYHASEGDAGHYANTVVDLHIGPNASANHVRIQDRGRRHLQTGRTSVAVGRDASFASAAFDLGGGLIRNDFVVDIAEPGAEVAFDGLYLAGDGQHVDNHTRVDHRVGPATSRQEFRGILNGKCRCVWNGKAIVHDGADGTDADQANHNLLLSEHAEIDAKPELEIYADDVKCSHGTTVGQLDETALFYLRTRGLDRQHATQVLTHAFAAGLVSRIPVDAARQAATERVEARLAELIQSDEEFAS